MNSRPDDLSALLACRFGDEGEFELQPGERQLLRDGEPVALTARAFGVLLALVAKAGQLVSKDELMQRVWAGLVVEDNNIAVHVAQLRKALGPRAIATIAGCGYRFAWAVCAAETAPASTAMTAFAEETPGNLPVRHPTLIGRDIELAALLALMATRPLVTVCGAAGMGKTQLAMAAAQARRALRPDGVFWIELAPLNDAEQVMPAIARAMGLKLAEGEAPLAALARRLRPLQALLVLDNAEHLATALAPIVNALVQGTQALGLLVTSQVPLRSVDEQRFPLGPLALPAADAAPDEARQSAALQLLALRAGHAGSPLRWTADDVALATEICQALDGNALAIELAAARLPALGLAGLAARLHQRLGLLAPRPQATRSRQNALATAMDWSHGLLGETEQRVFRRLAVFPGTFELDAAALCLADDALPADRVVETVLDLVDRSLVHRDRASPSRYRLLETGRLYAQAQLDASAEAAAVQRAFCRGMQRWMATAYEQHFRSRRQAWRTQWAPELDNLHAALDAATAADPETALALYGHAWPLWEALFQQAEGRRRADRLASLLHTALPLPLQARFWESVMRCHSVEYPQRAREAALRAAQLHTETGHALGQYIAWVDHAFNWRVDHPEARHALAKAKALEDPSWPAFVLAAGRTTEATLELNAGRHAQGRVLLQSILPLCERDDDLDGLVRATVNLADMARAAGEVEEAVRQGEALLARVQGRRPADFTLLGNLIGALLALDRIERAREVVALCERQARHFAEDSCLWNALDAFGLLHALDGRSEAAARLAGAADQAYADHGQHQRQPNEMADRRRLDDILAQQADETLLATWRTEGRRMPMSEALRLAFSSASHPPRA